MAQNFKTSEADVLFGVKSVKETFSGAAYKEISENLERALSRNRDLKTIIWTMDTNAILRDKDYVAYDEYPVYLYDDNPWNDVNYVFNKEVWYHGVLNNLLMTITGQPSTTFDEYSSWEKETGYENVMASYDRYRDGDREYPAEFCGSREPVSGYDILYFLYALQHLLVGFYEPGGHDQLLFRGGADHDRDAFGMSERKTLQFS